VEAVLPAAVREEDEEREVSVQAEDEWEEPNPAPGLLETVSVQTVVPGYHTNVEYPVTA